jgi:uncharacterized RDD family membrane protein YckC
MSAGHERVSLFLDGARRNRRDIISPEGVAVPVEIATVGERAAAFVLDLFIWLCASLLFYLLAALLLGPVLLGIFGGLGGALAVAIILFIAFFVRNFYFIHFELVWQGATPGKRIVGLRVIDRRGGPLLPSAVIARNLTREIEMFLPLGLLLSLGGAAQGVAGWEKLSLAVWFLLFAALPFFNRDRMRAGDLIAGTMVISLPRRGLLRDLVGESFHYSFSAQQLKAYGAFELQILEEMLRQPNTPEVARIRREVCDKICRKIAWPAPVPEAARDLFLKDFYAAERAYLEREQLFGKPRADKHASGKPTG